MEICKQMQQSDTTTHKSTGESITDFHYDANVEIPKLHRCNLASMCIDRDDIATTCVTKEQAERAASSLRNRYRKCEETKTLKGDTK